MTRAVPGQRRVARQVSTWRAGASSAVGPISTSPAIVRERCTPRNGSAGSGTG